MAVRKALSPEGLRSQYTDGVPNPDMIAPEGYTLDAAMIARPGNMDIQLDLFLDYANNVKLYPAFQDLKTLVTAYLEEELCNPSDVLS